MENAILVAMWAAAVAAIAGPLVAVIAAHQMNVRDSDRREGAILIRQVAIDILTFRSLWIHFMRADRSSTEAQPALTGMMPPGTTSIQYNYPKADAKQRFYQTVDRRADALCAVEQQAAVLQADLHSMRVFFRDFRASESIVVLVEMPERLRSDDEIDFNATLQRIDQSTTDFLNETARLSDQLRKRAEDVTDQ